MTVTQHQCNITVDGIPTFFNVEGEAQWGHDVTLYSQDGVLANTEWKDRGFTVMSLFNSNEVEYILKGTRNILLKIFKKLEFKYPDDFHLRDYHSVVTTNEMHQAVIKHSRMLTNADFPIELDQLSKRISTIIGRQLSPVNRVLLKMNNSPAKEIVQLRISRPQSMDINPLHRDGYLDFYKYTLNLWIPVVGCNEKSSLPVIPGSHLWNEKDVYRTENRSARIEDLNYNVPAIIKSQFGLSAVRPNPSLGEALVFTPFLIHGAGFNRNVGMSRMAFELRLFDEESYIKGNR
jgi:hypothetical protein